MQLQSVKDSLNEWPLPMHILVVKAYRRSAVEKFTIKKWDQKRKQGLSAVAAVALIFFSAFALGRGAAAYVTGKSVQAENDKICVVIDAGHGGSNLRQEHKTGG